MSKSKLIVTTPSDLEISMERTFDAPRDLVWKAYTDPEMLKQWWGQRANVTTVEQYDMRPGGKWRMLETAPDGTVHAFRGEILAIDPPNSLSQTFEYEPMAGHIARDTATFEEVNGKTIVRTISQFASKEDRDGMLSSGMETGANESYDQLEELLAAHVRA